MEWYRRSQDGVVPQGSQSHPWQFLEERGGEREREREREREGERGGEREDVGTSSSKWSSEKRLVDTETRGKERMKERKKG